MFFLILRMGTDIDSRFGLLPTTVVPCKEPTNETPFEFCSIKDFTVELGIEKVNLFIQQWDISEQWLNCIDYLGNTEEEFNTIYTYRVLYSIPTRVKPIPTATASVYFKIKKSKVKPEK